MQATENQASQPRHYSDLGTPERAAIDAAILREVGISVRRIENNEAPEASGVSPSNQRRLDEANVWTWNAYEHGLAMTTDPQKTRLAEGLIKLQREGYAQDSAELARALREYDPNLFPPDLTPTQIADGLIAIDGPNQFVPTVNSAQPRNR